MKINTKYLFAFLVLLLIEIMIALFVHDRIIRPYIGDILVVFLMYSFIRGIVGTRIRLLPVYLFLFSSLIEIAQYLKIVNILNLQDNRFFSIILGTHFDIKDILCYLIASMLLFLWEKRNK